MAQKQGGRRPESHSPRTLSQAERRELLRIFSEEDWRTSDDEHRQSPALYLALPPDC